MHPQADGPDLQAIRDEIQAPMATLIIFGLISSTALNMVVVPAAYYSAHRRPASGAFASPAG